MSIPRLRFYGEEIKIGVQQEDEKIIAELIREQPGTDLQLQSLYAINEANRAAAREHELELDASSAIELIFEDETTTTTTITRWLCNQNTIEEILPEVKVRTRDGAVTYILPGVLQADEQQRETGTSIVLKFLKVFTQPAVKRSVAELAKQLEDKQLENQRGLFFLEDNFALHKASIPDNEAPYLLFIHGTASSITGAFADLKNTEVWRHIRNQYDKRVLAFQHRTLSESPLANVLDLVQQLPSHATLHLITHSRGGLIGEILSRCCTDRASERGFSLEEINFLRKNKRTQDIETIANIQKALLSKNISVTKFIRVACPASGTTLASKRLDHYFNTVFNLPGLAAGNAGNPVYVAFSNLLAAVIECKNDPDTLPGLECQSPDSPFIEMLNNAQPPVQIGSPLLVIAGKSRPGLRWKGLMALLSKLYYRGANDLIVDTASMYNGAKRLENKVQYFLDESQDTFHFNYFKNASTRFALQLALEHKGDTPISGFARAKQVHTEEEIRNALPGLEGGKLYRDKVSGKKPIAVILPGIMGSNLSMDGQKLWLNYLKLLAGRLTLLEYNNGSTTVKADSLISTAYESLADHLEKEQYDVVTFPFDWRVPLEESASLLNNRISLLLEYKQPLKLIGHSMGGLVIREFMMNHPQTWQTLNKSNGFRMLFLGVPMGGCFRIPYLLLGEDDIIKTLSKADILHTKKELLQVFCKLPGLLHLLPLSTTDGEDYANASTWAKLKAAAFGSDDWPLPPPEALAAFQAYRDKVLQHQDTIDYSNAVYIAGQNRQGKITPKGYRVDNGRIVYVGTQEGDESVTWESGIPSGIKARGNVYYSDVTHGALACERRLFKAITDILHSGATTLLRKTPPALRSLDTEYIVKPNFNFDTSPGSMENTLLGIPQQEQHQPGAIPISISLSNGDLKYATYPVLVGHFQYDGLFSAEKSINRYLDGELERRQQLGIYPGEPGSSEIFIAERSPTQYFPGAIIAGLGRQGELTPFLLSRAVEQAISKYLSGFNSKVAVPNPQQGRIGITTLAIGCGYGGLSIESSVRAVIQGVQQANQLIRQIYESPVTVDEMEFIELFHDKALAVYHAIGLIEKDENRSLNIIWKNRKINKRLGSKERLPIDNTSDWWTRINVRQLESESQDEPRKQRGLRFNISTDAAREEERLLLTPRATILELLREMSTLNRWKPSLAKAIFELLIPNDFKEQIKRQNNINWIVDKETAAYPWELLQDSTTNTLPLSVSAGMIRQLTTKDYRIKINPVMEQTALIVADPDLQNTYGQLRGALQEGQLANELFTAQGYNPLTLLNRNAGEILLALFSKSYKVLHLAGHGAYNAKEPDCTGMLIGPKAFLTPAHISQMSTVPELVFVNCCYLGQMDNTSEALYQDRYKLAANIGTQLIDIGVKAVIVAGWAVDDIAALEFMEKFYDGMFSGYRFGTAVKRARKHVYERHGHRSNTWGAYQCYGDPFYTLVRDGEVEEKIVDFTLSEEAEICLRNLRNLLETGDADTQCIKEQLQKTANYIDAAQLRTPRITQLEALLHTGLGQYETAIAKFKELFKNEKAEFEGTSMEKYCNVRMKYYIQLYRLHKTDSNMVKKLIEDTDEVIADLEFLQKYGETVERLNLLGSTYKRKAMMSTGEAKVKAYVKAEEYYHKAYQRKDNHKPEYSLTNLHCIANTLVLSGYRKWPQNADNSRKRIIDQLLGAITENEKKIEKAVNEVDYWDLVTDANLRLVLMLIDEDKAPYLTVLNAYLKTWKKAGHAGNKQAEIEQFEFLEDALGMPNGQATAINKQTSQKLLGKIQEIRKHLETLL